MHTVVVTRAKKKKKDGKFKINLLLVIYDRKSQNEIADTLNNTVHEPNKK